MQNKEIEKILDANVDIITYKADKDFRCLTSTEKTLLENNNRIKQYIEQLETKVKELEKENTDIKEVYIRTAKHLDKKGHFELSEYMLAQIEATPTFTTWEEYTTWISKDKIREIIKELDIDIERNKRREINNTKEGYLQMTMIAYDPEIIKMRLLKLLEE